MTHLTREEHAQAGELFERAMALPASDRARAVRDAEECSVRAREEALALLAHDPADGFLQRPASTPTAIQDVLREVTADEPRSLIGSRVGAYRIDALRGVGGMGAVYRARAEPTGDFVALKVLRPHAMTKTAVLRLQREARVLSRLSHPCIARLLDTGESDNGRAYFAMELFEGAAPITAWAAVAKPSARETLALFARLCDAVHHGHQRGVIHRDLKPHNILIAGDGSPKLIDFGVAFATDSDITRVTLSADAGTLVGTFAYMSPEQCEGDAAAVDTRSDVYALGVVLFEVLAGQRPHDLEGKPLAEVFRVIRAGATRHLEHVRPDLAGDIATMIHKAMDPDPDRRYASAADFAQDIERFLTNRPIEARPAGAWYHARLTWRRNRASVSAAGVAAACVIGAGVVSVTFGVQAREEAGRAKAALALEADARARAEHATRFLRGAIGSANPYQPQRVNPVLLASAADPWAEWMFSPWDFSGNEGNKSTVEDVLLAAAKRLPIEFADDPASEADLSETLGVSLYRLERYPQARVLLLRCAEIRLATLGESHDDTIRAMIRVGNAHEDHQPAIAEPWYARAYALCITRYGPQHAKTLRVHRMLVNIRHALGGNVAGELLAVVPVPGPDSAPVPPEQLMHVALAAHLMNDRKDPASRDVALAVLRRLDAGDAANDPLSRVLTRRAIMMALFDTRSADPALLEQIAILDREATEVFGAWGAEYMNTMTMAMWTALDKRDTTDAAVYFARASRAHLRLRAGFHWETTNSLLAARYAAGRMDHTKPGAAQAARDIIAALAEFPQGLTAAGVVAECVLARTEIAAGTPLAGLSRIDAVLLIVNAPQAPELQEPAWVRLLTVRGECLEALGRLDNAKHEYRVALEHAARIADPVLAAEWSKEAREYLSRP